MPTNAVANVKQQAMAVKKSVTLESMIEKSISQLKHALPQGMSAERIGRIALTCLRINPKLYDVAGRNPQSFLAALFQSAQLGLEPNTVGEAWLIPYGNEVKFQIGKFGWAKMFYNHQSSVDIQAETVYEKDFFECNMGTKEINHVKPRFGEDRGPAIGYYAQIRLANGGKIIKTMSVAETKAWAIRFSKCWSKKDNDFIPGTPWHDHFNAMSEGTVLKLALKEAPKSAEAIKKAFAMDETVKTKVEADMAEVPNEIDYSKQAEGAEEIPAETVPDPVVPSNEPEREPHGMPELAPEKPSAPINETASHALFQEFKAKVESAKTRADVNVVFKAVEKDVQDGHLSEIQMKELLGLMKSRTEEIKKEKK